MSGLAESVRLLMIKFDWFSLYLEGLISKRQFTDNYNMIQRYMKGKEL